LEALVFDQFLEAISDVEVPMYVYISDVSCLEISVRGECIGGTCGIVQITFEDVWTLEPNFAWHSDGDFSFVQIHDLRYYVGTENSDGADELVPVFPPLKSR
jgi:hypothetical protein